MAKYQKIARFHPYMVYVWSIPDLALNMISSHYMTKHDKNGMIDLKYMRQ